MQQRGDAALQRGRAESQRQRGMRIAGDAQQHLGVIGRRAVPRRDLVARELPLHRQPPPDRMQRRVEEEERLRQLLGRDLPVVAATHVRDLVQQHRAQRVVIEALRRRRQRDEGTPEADELRRADMR
ncbi:MAG TPA: hypothetical protein VGF28_14620 [Thermoanaerobaculia bacterium]|jgi:hypothetical protein